MTASEHDEIVRSSSHVSSSDLDWTLFLEVAEVYEFVRMHKNNHIAGTGFKLKKSMTRTEIMGGTAGIKTHNQETGLIKNELFFVHHFIMGVLTNPEIRTELDALRKE